MSLRTKILIIGLVFLLLIFGLVFLNTWLFSVNTAINEENRYAEFISKIIQDLINFNITTTGSNEIAWGEIEKALSKSTLISSWAITTKSEGKIKLMSSSQPPPSKKQLEDNPLVSRVFEKRELIVAGNQVYLPLISPLQEQIFVAKIELKPLSSPRAQMADMLVNILFIMLLGSLLILICIYLLLNLFIIRPLEKLKISCQRLAKGDFSAKLPYTGKYDEISHLYEIFNQMLDDLHKHKLEREKVLERTEKLLFLSQRMSSAGALLAEVAHEINNPLGGVINAFYCLKDEELDEQKKKQYVELICEGLERIQRTVSNVLNIYRRAPTSEPVCLKSVIENTILLLQHKANKKGVKIINEINDSLPYVKANSTEIQQVFLNLLLNAIDACVIEEGVVKISADADKKVLKIHIRDNGHGMSPDEIKMCTEPFFSTKGEFGGTGLGLAVTNKIVQHYGGYLDIQSQKGLGTTVTVVFPYT